MRMTFTILVTPGIAFHADINIDIIFKYMIHFTFKITMQTSIGALG